ncbi:glycoside hydrolase family 26 protein [Flavobacterium silvaticum]|uniref:Beta-mannosidase n=1 Tax=Flavobacterium silvaticum TaxID=1852020 RepID=A0A972JHR6_9FLAO|nr:glycosyl hydrolase [Flavobacterium silvaticum]NMH27418.1 beta-mannosidase [Flavobacterium silvaticum]
MKTYLPQLIALLFLANCSSDKDTASQPTQVVPVDDILTPANVRTYMVDAAATAEATALFYNLKKNSAVNTAIGQQDAFGSFYGAEGDSDMKKTTGHDPALLGSDFMFITDADNNGQPNNWFFQQEQKIISDARQAYSKGMINTFCWHLREPNHEVSFYAADMTDEEKQTAFVGILPGGIHHDWFKAKLDKVAQVLNDLKDSDGVSIPVIFRPFHEFDGNWFWWGKDYCSDAQYKEAYQFVVTYLRDVKGVHNVLYAFSPDNSYTSETAYLTRYPGDDFVDVLGMDNYGDMNGTQSGILNAAAKLEYLSALAYQKVKIAALTETGYRVTNTIPPVDGWFTDYLYAAMNEHDIQLAYVMFWNNSADGYYVPIPSSPNASDFISFSIKPGMQLVNNLPELYQFTQ